MEYQYRTILTGSFHNSGEGFRRDAGILKYNAPLAPESIVTFIVRKENKLTTMGKVDRVYINASHELLTDFPQACISIGGPFTFEKDLDDLILNHKA